MVTTWKRRELMQVLTRSLALSAPLLLAAGYTSAAELTNPVMNETAHDDFRVVSDYTPGEGDSTYEHERPEGEAEAEGEGEGGAQDAHGDYTPGEGDSAYQHEGAQGEAEGEAEGTDGRQSGDYTPGEGGRSN